MRIIGIDPGYAIIGYGVIDCEKGKIVPVSYGVVTTGSDVPFARRLCEIYGDLNAVIADYKPQIMAAERLYFTTNQKTAIEVAEARGIILLAGALNALEIAEYTPLQVKQSVTGYGKAVKKQMQEMTKRILGLPDIPKPDDAADALAIAICAAHSYSSKMRV